MNEIIAQLFAARNVAHALHLSTRSFAQHLALDDLYHGLVEKADELAETYAGKYGVLNIDPGKPAIEFPRSDAVTFIRAVATWADGVGAGLKGNGMDSYILNQWDEILALINKTKYKLENLH